MTTADESETVLVVGDHVVVLGIDTRDAPSSMEVTLHLDGRRLRSFEEPGWRVPRCGFADAIFFWWSARRFVAFPVGAPTDVEQIKTDEDIVLSFRRADGWLLVCESSLRLVFQGLEVARLEYDEVLIHAHLEGDLVVLVDALGATRRAVVTSGGIRAVA